MKKREDHWVEALLCLVFVMLGLVVFAPNHFGALLGEAALFAAIGSACALAPRLRRAVSSTEMSPQPDTIPSVSPKPMLGCELLEAAL